MNRTSSYDELFARYWQWLLERFRNGERFEYAPREVSPGKGNPRRVEYMDEEVIRLRETTSRGLLGTCLMTQLRDDFWKLCQDPEVENKPLSMLRQQHGIKNFVEFKRHMFEEFRQFASGSPDLQSSWVGTETAGLSDEAIDQAIRSHRLRIGIIPTKESPRPVSTMPPFQSAQEYLERLRALAGLPERNVEDAVKDLLLYLGHERGRIVFQIGRIDGVVPVSLRDM